MEVVKLSMALNTNQLVSATFNSCCLTALFKTILQLVQINTGKKLIGLVVKKLTPRT